ncbi:hypothetical protein GHT06_003613 [Daphnia sinensis]|uniref:Uncharacterized protein n=1 Tax=Daphnia sinensis TaxID=1820382 RepID=A0AAD5KFW4_9CRUS|nr:hypothetical protein GHT06_003613 [Daphnia sinensis]
MFSTCFFVLPNRAVKHAALRIFHKCENSHLCLSCLLPLQPLMEKPSSSR